MALAQAYGSGSSVVVTECQSCGHDALVPLLFLGYLPPVNQLRPIGAQPHEQSSYPAQWLFCPRCMLVQLGLIVDPLILFPASYPYTSSTTRILRENFAELAEECAAILSPGPDDLVVDIGSNDGNLLSNFVGKHRVLGITPEDIGRLAIQRGIPTLQAYFNAETASRVLAEHGSARIVCATNVFAHIEDVNAVTSQVISLLHADGVFISESHYLLSLVETLQYDTIYHEHLRYYSLHSLKALLVRHGLEVFHAKRIPTHGGSIRVYAGRPGRHPVRASVAGLLEAERPTVCDAEPLRKFGRQVAQSKLELLGLLRDLKRDGKSVWGVSAPSRASTLVDYTGIDDAVLDRVIEIHGSHKIGHTLPGTLIPILEEPATFADGPDVLLLLSWHIADELMPKLVAKGFRGAFLIPLPEPRVVASR